MFVGSEGWVVKPSHLRGEASERMQGRFELEIAGISSCQLYPYFSTQETNFDSHYIQ